MIRGDIINRSSCTAEEVVRREPRSGRLLLGALLVGYICHLATKLGFALMLPPDYISPLWPTNAFLFAVLLATPTWTWWVYVPTAIVSVIITDLKVGLSIPAVFWFIVGQSIEVLIAAVGVRRFANGPRAFRRLGSLVVYIIVAALLAPFISAFADAFTNTRGNYWFEWRAWFFSEVLAFLTFAPAIVTGTDFAGAALKSTPWRYWAELSAVGCGLLATNVLVFGRAAAQPETIPALLYLPLPFLLWAAARFGPSGASTSLLIVALSSIFGTVLGRGPFTNSSPVENILALQTFLVPVSLTQMFLGALSEEWREKANALGESEARFRAMADHAPVLIWMSGQDKLCTFFNKGWLDFTGRTMEEELGEGWVRGVHSDDVRECLRTYVNAFEGRREFSMEYRLRRFDGEYRWVLDQGVPRFATDGEFLGYVGCASDITESKKAVERPRQVLEAAPNAMIIVTEEGKITSANAAVEAVFGYLPEELIGRPIEMLVPESLRGRHADYRKSYFAAPTRRSIGAGRELFGRRKNGAEVPVEIGLTPIEMSEGLFVLASIIDITERKETELSAQRLRAELAHVLRFATMGELAASLAHELNQPLTAILSNVQAAQRFLAAEPADLSEIREILSDVARDDTRAGEVIRRLRALITKDQSEFVPLDLRGVLGDVVVLIHSDAILRNSRVSLDIDATLPPVRGDRIQLQQVILNLLMNALDAMKDCSTDERCVTVRAETQGARTVRVAVRDRGTGLGGNLPRDAFQPFYTTKRGGLGMGLSISRSIIQAHGGRLWAENNPDRGATLYFTIPVAEE